MFPKDADRSLFQVKGVFTARSLAVMGLMLALTTILSLFSFNITPTLKAVSFTFIPDCIVAILYGPIAALAFGAVSDLFGYIANPMGVYFPGYALSAMATNLIYALLLYRRPISLWRVFAARALITALVTLSMNYLWNIAMYGATASAFFTSARLIGNLVKLPLYALLTYIVGKIALSTALQFRLVDPSGATAPARPPRSRPS